MAQPGLPANFRLNLTAIAKNANTSLSPPDQFLAGVKDDNNITAAASTTKPPANIDDDSVKHGATANQRPRPGAAPRNSTTLARKNLVIQSSDDDSDFDLDLEMIPVGKESAEEKKESPHDEVEAPVVQVSQLPELDVDDDDELQIHGEGNKFAILYDLLLTQEQAEEPPEEWSYKSFIKQFANSEASQENMDDGEDEYDMEDDEEEDDYES